MPHPSESERNFATTLNHKINSHQQEKNPDILLDIHKTIVDYHKQWNMSRQFAENVLKLLIDLPGFKTNESCCGKNFKLESLLNPTTLPTELSSLHGMLRKPAFARAFEDLVECANLGPVNQWRAGYKKIIELPSKEAQEEKSLTDKISSTNLEDISAGYTGLASMQQASAVKRAQAEEKQQAFEVTHQLGQSELVNAAIRGWEADSVRRAAHTQQRVNIQQALNASTEASIDRIKGASVEMTRTPTAGRDKEDSPSAVPVVPPQAPVHPGPYVTEPNPAFYPQHSAGTGYGHPSHPVGAGYAYPQQHPMPAASGAYSAPMATAPMPSAPPSPLTSVGMFAEAGRPAASVATEAQAPSVSVSKTTTTEVTISNPIVREFR